MKRVALVTFGSAGDVHPMLALGQALRDAGHEAVVVTNPAFETEVCLAGLAFAGAGTLAHWEATIRHPKLWHPIDGLGVMWRYLLRPALEPTYAVIAQMAAQGPVTVVASPVAMGARVAQEKLGVPLVTAYTAATMLRTVHDPMTLAQWTVPPLVPRWARALAWRLFDATRLQPLVTPALEALRSGLGLRPLGDSVFGQWMHSPQAGLALFPSWFAQAQPDWPAQVKQAGFPLHDGPVRMPPSLESFLAAGDRPVVFMPGTAAQGQSDYFRRAAAACAALGRRGVLLGAQEDTATAASSSHVIALPSAPFASLLPQCAALVHHGGIGSTAQALRAGIPQVVLPRGYDQFDNALRIERLGVGVAVNNSARLEGALRAVLAPDAVASACALNAARTTPDAARREAVACVEALA